MVIEDKRVRRTRKLLRQALTDLMREKEFKNITVSDVVRCADISRGTFYVYYRDVYDLREKVENEMLDALRCRNGNLTIVCGRAALNTEEL